MVDFSYQVCSRTLMFLRTLIFRVHTVVCVCDLRGVRGAQGEKKTPTRRLEFFII